MLKDLFSHKIHASENIEDWKRTLVKVAKIFLDFDKQIFDRTQLNERFYELAPNTKPGRDPFRDIFSIYMTVLGVGHIVWQEENWKVQISETARRYLIGIEPNVEAFCRLQLSLYQRPDGRGQRYNLRKPQLQANARDKTLDLIREGYQVSPLRLILKIFEAKAYLQGSLQDEISVTPEEIYTLLNCHELRGNPSPPVEEVREALERFNNEELIRVQGDKRFLFLEATGLFTVEPGNNLKLSQHGDYNLNYNRNLQIEAIKLLDYFFKDFNQCTEVDELYEVLASGSWANYFDACNTLSAKEVQEIAGEIIISQTLPPSGTSVKSITSSQPSLLLQPRRIERASKTSSAQRKQSQITDPESTRILRERRNAWHDLLVQKMSECIKQAGLEPLETDLIDVLAHLDSINRIYPSGFPIQNTNLDGQLLPYFSSERPENLTFIFEMKSSDKSIIVDQVRKAVSQLYEYRYRHRYHSEKPIRENAVLVIVLQQSPDEPSWLKEYLLFDRHIAVCWLREDQSRFDCFDECQPILEPLITC
jgi:hypothetical protein